MNDEEPMRSATNSEEGMTTGAPITPAQTVHKTGGWLLTLTLGLLAGVAAWLCGESTLGVFKPDEKVAAEPYKFTLLNQQIGEANALNGALAFGALGGALGLALGLAGGLSANSVGRSLAGASLGLVLGTAAG